MEEIMKITKLLEGYEFKVMNKYNVEDYWKVLDETAIFINTSRYESFCCALFEARAKGVATIQPKLLNGVGVHEKAPIQVEYEAEVYRDKILELLKDEKYKKVGEECREYCVKNASLKIMRDDMTKIYKEVYNENRFCNKCKR
jgi:glycosyltransferase involved in cell wall biosynthesis